MPTLAVGEPALAIDTRTLYVGTPAGNVILSRDLQSFIDEYTKFLDEVNPLIASMIQIQTDLDVEALNQLSLDLQDASTMQQEILALQTEKVDKVAGKGLSTNDYTTTEKTKLASLSQVTPVTVSTSVTSTSTTTAASSSAVKSAYDEAQLAKQSASDGKIVVASAITGKGVAASGTDTFAALASKITSIPAGTTGKPFATGTLAAGGGVINAGFPIKFLMSLNTVDNELVTLAPATWNGFGVGHGYDFAQGRTTVSWSGNTATLGGAHANDATRWIALG